MGRECVLSGGMRAAASLSGCICTLLTSIRIFRGRVMYQNHGDASKLGIGDVRHPYLVAFGTANKTRGSTRFFELLLCNTCTPSGLTGVALPLTFLLFCSRTKLAGWRERRGERREQRRRRAQPWTREIFTETLATDGNVSFLFFFVSCLFPPLNFSLSPCLASPLSNQALPSLRLLFSLTPLPSLGMFPAHDTAFAGLVCFCAHRQA